MTEPQEDKNEIEVLPDEMAITVAGQNLSPMAIQEGMSLLPVDQQKPLLAEYDKRRDFFLSWLLEHLKEGVHYGFPPGCQPREGVNLLQWKAKPSLYKAGALLLTDLLKMKPSYSLDKDSWEQFGSRPGLICMKCELYQGEHLIGEGRGTYAVGEKSGMKENATVKMAEKRALVDAVIGAIPVVGDLFTQDEPVRLKEKMTVDERKKLLVEDVKKKLVELKSSWSGTAGQFVAHIVKMETGGDTLGSIGSVNNIEKVLLKDNKYDWDTGDAIPDSVGKEKQC